MLFFVSVGMLIEPAFVLAEPGRILVVTAIIVVGKTVAAFLIVLLLRGGLEKALVVAAALAQIGEFSFILATLGRSLDLLSADGYNLILAGALVSITLNPLLFRAVPVLRGWLQQSPEPSGPDVSLEPETSRRS